MVRVEIKFSEERSPLAQVIHERHTPAAVVKRAVSGQLEPTPAQDQARELEIALQRARQPKPIQL